MKLVCKREPLFAAASKTFSAVSKKSTIPALEGILLKAEDGVLTLCGYDLEIGIRTVVECSVVESGSVVLPGKILNDIIRNLPGENVNIICDDKNKCLISSGISEFTVSGIAASEFPELPVINDSVSVTLKSSALADLIKKTIFAIAVVDYRPVYTGAKFSIENKKLTVTAIDNYRLAKAETPVDFKGEESFIIPGKSLHELLRLLTDKTEEPVKISIEKRHILFEIDKGVFISRLLEGEFINADTVIPKKSCTFVKIKTKDFIDSLERVSLMISTKQKSPVRCEFTDNLLKLLCITSIGKGYDEAVCEITGEDIEIGFNHMYLLDALRACDTDQVKLSMTNPSTALIITPNEGEDFVFLVGPMKLKNE